METATRRSRSATADPRLTTRRSWVWIVALAATALPARAQTAIALNRGLTPGHESVVEFVSTASFGVAMNDLGDITGTSYLDTGCGPFCLPPLETVVWRGAERIVLPSVPGLSGIYVRDINNQGWVVGLAGFPYTTTHAVVWKPIGTTYQAIDLGALPGNTVSEAVGIDDLGRVIGWSTTLNWPPDGSPFLWTEASGMIDLSAQGYPDEIPLAISRGGTVATASTWYRLGDPSSVVAMPPPPSGYGIGNEPTAINDAGDQARFLARSSGQNLRYLFRFHHEGTWQQISGAGTGHLSRYGVGSITDDRTVTATVQSTAVIAFGPNGDALPLSAFLSPAYGDSVVIDGGAMNHAGEILAQVLIGRSQRLVRLTPARDCIGGCIHVSNLAISADFVPDPNDPTGDHCTQDGTAHNVAQVSVTISNGFGAPVKGAFVAGRFLDDYWTDEPVSGVTDQNGVISFTYTGPCGVGAITFLVDAAIKGDAVFDRTVGVLTSWVIPQ